MHAVHVVLPAGEEGHCTVHQAGKGVGQASSLTTTYITTMGACACISSYHAAVGLAVNFDEKC
jgi:hypothetical protein